MWSTHALVSKRRRYCTAYLIFFSRWEMGAPWSYSGIEGRRWLRRTWSMFREAGQLNPNPKALRRKATKPCVASRLRDLQSSIPLLQLDGIAEQMGRLRMRGPLAPRSGTRP